MRDIHKGKKVVSGQSLAASFNSEALNTYDYPIVLIRVETDSVTDNTGTFSIQHRIKAEDGTTGAWADFPLSSPPALSDDDAVLSVYLTDVPPGELRVAFTAAGGSPDGTCDIWFCGRRN